MTYTRPLKDERDRDGDRYAEVSPHQPGVVTSKIATPVISTHVLKLLFFAHGCMKCWWQLGEVGY